MSLINRKVSPEIHSVDIENLNNPKIDYLDNNIPVYTINSGTQNIIKIDFIFNAGYWFQSKPLIASTVNSMLTEGTAKMKSIEISETIDYYGAFLSQTVNNDTAILTLYTLNKFVNNTIYIIEDILKNSIFAEDELKTNLSKRKQNFMIDNQKTNILANRKFNEALFGKSHPYSKVLFAEDYEKVTRNMVIDFYNKFYTSGNCKIVVSGKVEKEVFKTLNNLFGQNDWIKNYSVNTNTSFDINASKEKKYFIKKDNAVQSAINIGKVTINSLHPDYQELIIVNTLLGGYFGSRLMKNIREKNGFTYGIYSKLNSYLKSGVFSVITEVKSEVTQPAIVEIYKEIERLRTEYVPENEIETVKKYMLGEILSMFDGAFAISESFISILNFGFDFNYYKLYLHKIKNITKERIKELALKYFSVSDLIEVIAGNKLPL